MKMISLILLSASLFVFSVKAQDVVSQQEWMRQYNESTGIAVKLFPDLLTPDSAIHKATDTLFNSISYCPRLLRDSYCPLFLATVSGQALNISPKWDALSAAEKHEAFQEIVYCTNLMTLAMAAQSRYLASIKSAPPVSMVTPQGFIPSASDNVSVRKTYHVDPEPPSYTATPDGNGNYTLTPEQ